MAVRNAFYAQSGGVTAVINASACGLLQTARQHRAKIGKVYAGRNGIIGALTEDLIDTRVESEASIAALTHTPGAAFGSCRYKLGSIHAYRAQYERLIEVFDATTSASFSTTVAATRKTLPIKSARWALDWVTRSPVSAFPRRSTMTCRSLTVHRASAHWRNILRLRFGKRPSIWRR
jgi:hypothetical protein